MTDIPELPLWKDYEFEVDVIAKAADTGVPGPAASLTITAYVETTIGAGAVDPSLSALMAERIAKPGRQSVVFDQPALAQHLATCDRRKVWICVQVTGDIDVERFQRIVRAVSQG